MPLLLDENGLDTETQQEIIERIGLRMKQQFGVNTKTFADSIMGQLINVMSEIEALDQQTLLAVYRSMDPQGAIGAALDARLTLTGTVRNGATNSVVDGLLAWSGAGTMNNGDLIRNDDNNTLWELSNGPIVSVGPSSLPAQFTAVDTGPISADAGTSWSLVTVVVGLTGFTNPSDDAEQGRLRESDADARSRRQFELFSQGTGPLDAIGGVVSKVKGVVATRVYHNQTVSPVDSDGIPFKAFNVVVETNPLVPGAALQQLIHDAIWSAMGAGGEAFGTDFSGTVVDTEGVAQPVAFDTIDIQDIDLEVTLTTSTSEEAVTPNIAAVVQLQLVTELQASFEVIGRDVLALDVSRIVTAMIDAGTITGVDVVTSRGAILPAGLASFTRLVMGISDKPDFDSVNIVVLTD